MPVRKDSKEGSENRRAQKIPPQRLKTPGIFLGASRFPDMRDIRQ